VLDEWSYAELRRMSSPEGVVRLGRSGETLLARLEIRDAVLAGAIEERAETLDRGGAVERRLRRKVVALSLAAGASLILTAIFGVPVLASRIIPFVPLAAERKLATRSTSKSARRSTRSISGPLSPAAPVPAKCPAARRSIRWSASSRRAPRCRSASSLRWYAGPNPMPWRCPADTSTSMKG
jgi:hypothetical protein